MGERGAARGSSRKSCGSSQRCAAGLKLYPDSQPVQVEAALAYAMMGDTAQAQSLERDLNQRYPLDTQVQSLWLPAIHTAAH